MMILLECLVKTVNPIDCYRHLTFDEVIGLLFYEIDTYTKHINLIRFGTNTKSYSKFQKDDRRFQYLKLDHEIVQYLCADIQNDYNELIKMWRYSSNYD